MKRLLLSQGRTGSLNLTRFIRESNKSEVRVYREPFNTTAMQDTNIIHSLSDILNEKNIFVENKIGKGSLPSEFQNKSYEDIISFFLKSFDIIGLLVRKDITSQIQSVLNAKSSGIWASKYYYKEIDENLSLETEVLLKEERNLVEDISNQYNIPLFYYEDLYISNQLENVKNFCKYFYLKFDENIMNLHMSIDGKYRIDYSKKVL